MKIKTNETFLNELKSFEAVAENEASKKMIEKIRANFENLEIPNGELLATLKDDSNFLNAIEKSMEKMKTASIRETKVDEKAFANKILTGIENGRFENSIETIDFPTSTEIAIKRAWEDNQDVLKYFKRTVRTAVPYTDQAQNAKAVSANVQIGDLDKEEQALVINYSVIPGDFIYKYQKVDKKDIMEARNAGTEIELVNEIFAELVQQVINRLVYGILQIGAIRKGVQFVKPISQRASTYSAQSLTLAGLRLAVSQTVGNDKILFINPTDYNTITTNGAAGANFAFLTKQELITLLGITDVVVLKYIDKPIVYENQSYFLRMNTMETFRNFIMAKNKEELLAEVFCGGDLPLSANATIYNYVAITITVTLGVVAVTTVTIADGTYKFTDGSVTENAAIATSAGVFTTIPNGTYIATLQSVGNYLLLPVVV